MKNMVKATAVALAAVALIIVSACTSLQGQAGTNESVGVMCNKCATTWVGRHEFGGKPGTYHVYRNTRKMICPQCESLAATFFRTGQLSHDCSACRGTLTRCAAQAAH